MNQYKKKKHGDKNNRIIQKVCKEKSKINNGI